MERVCIVMERQEVIALADLVQEFINTSGLEFTHKALADKLIKQLQPIKRVQKIEIQAGFTHLFESFCLATGFSQEDLRSKTRTQELADARFTFVNIAIDIYNVSERELAALINRDHSTINFYKKGMECPQKREIYLEIKTKIENQPWREK